LRAPKTACDPSPDWTSTMPSPPSAVHAVLVDFGTAVLAPGQSVVASYDMTDPPTIVRGTSWNSFGFAGLRADNLEALAPPEPDKVGLAMVGDVPGDAGISIVKRINGIYAPNPPGAFIPAGTPIEFTYVVTNTGSTPLVDLSVVDDQLGPISCPATTLAPGQ